jgi:hypothetical protein
MTILAKGECVLKDWVLEMPGRMQVVVIAAIRGPDSNADDTLKRVTRWVRKQVLKDTNPAGHFMRDVEFVNLKSAMEQNSYLWDGISLHWYVHMTEALAIIGYFHPDEMIAAKGLEAYTDMREHFNAKPESKAELLGRLKDKPGTLAEQIAAPTTELPANQPAYK